MDTVIVCVCARDPSALLQAACSDCHCPSLTAAIATPAAPSERSLLLGPQSPSPQRESQRLSRLRSKNASTSRSIPARAPFTHTQARPAGRCKILNWTRRRFRPVQRWQHKKSSIVCNAGVKRQFGLRMPTVANSNVSAARPFPPQRSTVTSLAHKYRSQDRLAQQP